MRGSSSEGLLQNENRREIARVVRENPAVTPSEVAEETDLSLSTVRYHLDLLEEESIVGLERRGSRIHCFPPDVEKDLRRAVAALTSDATLRVAASVVEAPRRSTAERAEEIGVSRQAVGQQLRRLEGAGLVSRRQEDDAMAVEAAEELERALDWHRGSPEDADPGDPDAEPPHPSGG